MDGIMNKKGGGWGHSPNLPYSFGIGLLLIMGRGMLIISTCVPPPSLVAMTSDRKGERQHMAPGTLPWSAGGVGALLVNSGVSGALLE